MKNYKLMLYTNSELQNMLESIVNELDLSAEMIEKYGPLGTAPAELVRLVLEQKNREINMLKAGMLKIEPKNEAPTCATCGSADTYTTTAYHCRRCATTTEM